MSGFDDSQIGLCGAFDNPAFEHWISAWGGEIDPGGATVCAIGREVAG
jgi:hypothetical protein